MFKFLSIRRLFTARNIRTRILTTGLTLAVIPILVVLAVIWIANGVAHAIVVNDYSALANQNSNRVVLGLLATCKLYNENLSNAVNGARVFLERMGPAHFDSRDSIPWQAKNQFTAQVTPIQLPLMRIGDVPLRPVSDFSKEGPIVDQVQALYQFSATVFQRMNDHGDMLRVSTTVKAKNGARAIGTFIPVIGADGQPNKVLAKVLKGETYLGRAFVVNSWYIAAYQPLKDAKGAVIGMIYTGAPEAPVRDKILQINAMYDGKGSDVFIVHTTAKEHGLFVLSNNPSLQDHNAWDLKDAHGDLYVQAICKKAVSSQAGVSEASYWSPAESGKPAQKMLVRLVYFKPWDWVIGVQEPEAVFAATPKKIDKVFAITDYLPFLVFIISAALTLFIWNKLTRQMIAQVGHVMQDLEGSSELVTTGLNTISNAADSLGNTAGELSRSTQMQAASAEQTSATTSQVTETAKNNSQAAEQLLMLATNSESLVSNAKKTIKDMNGAMSSIMATNDEVLTIIDTLNEISFATNIVALNTSVEAARAGDAGRTFVFIAQEVKDLAGKAAKAVQDTREIIHNSRRQIAQGTDLVSKLGQAFDPLNQNADQVRKLAGNVTAVSVKQAAGLEQVSNVIEQIRKATGQTAQSALQSTENASELRSQVSALGAAVKTVDQAIERLRQEFLAKD